MNQILKRTALVILSGGALSCGEPVVHDRYLLAAPAVPAAWLEVLGAPHWRFEWLDTSGALRRREQSAAFCEAEILQTCASPVLAFPYWTEKDAPPGIMKPAGALFPFDAAGGTLNLSWEGGVDAVLYLALAAQSHEKRLPYQFDWLKFRALWTEGKLDGDVLRDRWLVDWRDFAEKTAASGMSVRRIKPRETENYIVSMPASGPWIGASPFAPPENWQAGTKVAFRVSAAADSYFCPDGALRLTQGASVWIQGGRLAKISAAR